MKKILRSMLVVMVLCLVLAAFTGCELLDIIKGYLDPACEHTGGEATCAEKAICELCGEEYGEALGHTEAVDEGKAPTCTEEGLTDGKHCSVCNEVLEEQKAVAALGHTEVTLEAVDATCTEAGLTEGKKCSVCEEVLVAQEAVDAQGHTEEVLARVEPTCTATGLTEGKKCSVCEEVLVAQVTLDIVAHTWVDATSEAPKHCSVCGLNHIVLYFLNVDGWEEVAFWAWTGAGNVFSAWPGQPMTKAEDSDWYTIEFDVPTLDSFGIIFNDNGKGAQTTDLAYDPAKTYWVGETAYASAGDYYKAEADKVIASIGTFPASVASDADRITVLQVYAEVASKYDALSEYSKIVVDGDPTYQALTALVKEITDAGYSFLINGNDTAGIASGRDTGNGGTITTLVDPAYGTVYSIAINNEKANGDFHFNNISFKNVEKVVFYVYNPYDADVNLALYDAAWGAGIRVATAAGRTWTRVEVDVNGTSYGEKNFFIIVCTGDMLGGNPDATAEGHWLVSSVMGYKAPPADPNAPVPEETTTVLANGTSAGHFYVYDMTNVDNPNAAITTGSVEGHGNVYNVAYNEFAVPTSIGLQTLNLMLTNYDKLRFEVYNPGDADITVSVQEMSGWNMIGTVTVAAGSWTTVEVDLTNTTANVLIYINGVAGTTYQMGQLVGVVSNK